MDIKTSLVNAKTIALAWLLATWNKVKDIVLAIVAVLALVLFGIAKEKSDKAKDLQEQLNLLQTQKDADDLQIKINSAISDAQSNGASADNLVALAQALAAKRASLAPVTGQTDQALSDSLNQELK